MKKAVLLKVSIRKFVLQGQNQAFLMDKLLSFRPILSTTGTPRYDLAKYLVPTLNPLTEKDYAVHDSFSIASEVGKFNSNKSMARLNVESLFTNIPLEETMENIINDLFLTTDKVHNFEREELKQLLVFAANESFFIFDGEYYNHIDGVAMGFPLCQIFDSAFLCHFQKKYL